MKRNLVPFLGIAFVVAIAATGIFYGLFVGKISGASPAPAPAGMVVLARPVDRGAILTAADVKVKPSGANRPEGAFASVEDVIGRTAAKPLVAEEPLTAAGLAGVAPSKNSGELAIPKGMRAISVRAADSAGLVPYLRPGHRVDVQVVEAHGGPATAKTILSNVQVLNVHTDASAQSGPAAVLNLLVPARDVDRVALADSAAKVRIVLRNPADDEESAPPPAAAPAARVAAIPPPAAASGPRVGFQVRMAAASAETIREIASRAGLAAGSSVGIGLLPAAWKAEELDRAKSIRLLSTENVESPHWYEVSLQAGRAPQNAYDLRLRLTPRGAANGVLRLRVKPELTLPDRGGVSSRRFSADLDVADGQSVLVAGFERDAHAPALIEKLFQSPVPPTGSELLFVVTPRLAAR
jgi:Flp pilus assembly protein CpaB